MFRYRNIVAIPGALAGIQCSGAEKDAPNDFFGCLDTPGTATGGEVEMCRYASNQGFMISLFRS